MTKKWDISQRYFQSLFYLDVSKMPNKLPQTLEKLYRRRRVLENARLEYISIHF